MLRPLVLASLTFVAAASLVSELATRDGVGIAEYVVGILLVAGLLFMTFRLVRRALRRTANP
jgi:hypothetical protein